MMWMMPRNLAALALTLLAATPVLAEETIAPLAPAPKAWIGIVIALALVTGVVMVNIKGSRRGKRE